MSDDGSAWNKLVTYKNKLYGVWFKGRQQEHDLVQPRRVRHGGPKVGTQDMAAAADRRQATLRRSGGHALLALHQYRLAGR